MRRIHGSSRLLRAAITTLFAAAFAGLAVVAPASSAATPPTLALRVLLIGSGPSDPTTNAWATALTQEGVPYSEVTAAGSAPSETVALPALSSGTTANFNAVVIADTPADFAPSALSALDSFESTFGIRQIDGYAYPGPQFGLSDAGADGPLDGTTGQLTAAGLSVLPELKGPIPFDTGTYGYPSTVIAGAAFTPWLDSASSKVLAGVYQHSSSSGDPQANVSEALLTFDYSATDLQWLLLAPGLINWVTGDTHLGLYRNYFGQDIDDNFIADNEWSSKYQCTPAATDPPDYTCPAGVANNTADSPPDVQMSAADVAYVVNWEKQTGITLNLAFNAVGACTAPSAAAESSANCTGSSTVNGSTYTDPGQVVDSSYPNDAGLVNALLANQSSFNWITHTWSHLFLGCNVWASQPLTSAVANASGGSLSAGSYSYEITSATAYGESEPSTAHAATVSAGGSVTLSWPDATNGTGTNGTAGPTLSAEEANHTGGDGFWGYDVYRENPGATTYGLVGQVPEDSTGATSTYTFTDTGATTPGAAPGSGPAFPTATNPGIDCSSAAGSWTPATSATPDSSIEQEIGLDDAFATANGLTNFTPSAVVTGEHSGVENPNMPAALAGVGVTTFATDASRQPQLYQLGAASSAPRYPSNVYYNASNWADELNEYATLYVLQGSSLGADAPASNSGEVGHCADTNSTTCVTSPPTEASFLASESRIMLGHVLANNPRVGYAHQSNLIGPDYTILALINDMLSQYDSWYTAPLVPMTDVSEVNVLTEQAAWASALPVGQVGATETNGVVTVTNSGTSSATVPVTVPTGTTVNGSPFGQSYGGELSGWTVIGGGTTTTLSEGVAPSILSSASATAIVGSAFSFTVASTGAPAATLTKSGTLPAGISFTDNGNGTATIAGTSSSGSGGSYPITISASNASGTATQTFTLQNAEAPTITSPTAASFSTGVAGSYAITTTGFPAPTITETGTLPTGLTFTDNGNGTGSISGTPAAGSSPTYPVQVQATNVSGSTATLSLTISVQQSAAPSFSSPSTAYFTVGSNGGFAVDASGSPAPALTETGALPPGLTFLDEGNGIGLLSGTPSSTGVTSFTVTAANGISPQASTTVTVNVGQGASFTSPATASFNAGVPASFQVSTTGFPAPSIGAMNSLPSGLTFTDNGNGTATISGTPAMGDSGSYAIDLNAVNFVGSTSQGLTLSIDHPPTITGPANESLTVGDDSSFGVTTTGYPTPAISESGVLPAGLRFVDNANGTATISGTPKSGSGGTYPITLTARNIAGAANTSVTVRVSDITAIAGSGNVTTSNGETTTSKANVNLPACHFSLASRRLTATKNGIVVALHFTSPACVGTLMVTGVKTVFTVKHAKVTARFVSVRLAQTPFSVNRTGWWRFTLHLTKSGLVRFVNARLYPARVSFVEAGRGFASNSMVVQVR